MIDKFNLAEKLKILGIRPASELKANKGKGDTGKPIESAVDGRYVQTSAGEIFVSEEIFGTEHHHGIAAVRVCTPIPIIARWTKEPRFEKLSLEEYAFLDTETSGLAGGTGTYAFLIGIARFVDDKLHLAQFFMRDPSEERALLEAVLDFLAPCKALVTFNGKAFDVPLLATRYALHQITFLPKKFAHLDLLPLARRLWRDRLPSRALKYLEENVLLAPRTIDEVPGYEIPYIYFDYLRARDATPLKGVFYHNAMDIVSLAALMGHITSILDDPLSPRIEHGLDVIALARLFEDLDEWERATQLFEHGLEMDLPAEGFWQAVRQFALLQKRRGNLDASISLWEKAANQGQVYAHVELAKYHEHICRDYETARSWTESAIRIIQEKDLPRFEYSQWMKELSHRQERLNEKTRR